jgi:hypothetical protein
MSIPVRGDTAFVGEVGLLGELRPVPAIEKRIQEARRMGFSRVVTPRVMKSRQRVGPSKPGFSRFMGIDWIQCDTLSDAINEGLVTRLPKGRRKAREKSDTDEDDKLESSSGRRLPGALGDLMLDQIITDDDDDDDEDHWS